MDRYVGTVVRGIRTPIIKEGDNLCDIVVDSLLKAKESEGFEFKDKDIVAVTEAVVSIADGNYVSIDEIAKGNSNLISNKPQTGDRRLFYNTLEDNPIKAFGKLCAIEKPSIFIRILRKIKKLI